MGRDLNPATGDVEDGVPRPTGTPLCQSAIERRHPGKRQPGARVLQKNCPRRADEISDVRLEDGVVHVADNAVRRGSRRREIEPVADSGDPGGRIGELQPNRSPARL